MSSLRRHQLVWLDEYGWFRVLAASTSTDQAPGADPHVLDCLWHWAAHDGPLVVTRQPIDPATAGPDAHLALGLPAPARWGRRPIAVTASLRAVARHGSFPAMAELGAGLPADTRAAWQALRDGLATVGVTARVYGSWGWQHLTGLGYVHPRSDIDLLLEVASTAQADAACDLLEHAAIGTLRVDGELSFADGAAIAWREWRRFRGGATDRVLIKRIASAALEDARAWEGQG